VEPPHRGQIGVGEDVAVQHEQRPRDQIGGIADNVIFVRRTKAKEGYTYDMDVTPMCVSVRKQRHYTGAMGDVNGWLHRNFRQFSKDQFAEQPVRYLPTDAYQ